MLSTFFWLSFTEPFRAEFNSELICMKMNYYSPLEEYPNQRQVCSSSFSFFFFFFFASQYE